MLAVISLAQYATACTQGWAANSFNARIRLKAQLDQARQEPALVREQMRIKDRRIAAIRPSRRPHYPPVERLAILQWKAAHRCSLEQTAKAFLVTATTIASWMQRLDEDGPHALVQLPQPVNCFPDFVSHAVQRLKALCPLMGKVKIAQTLTRAGLHLGAATVGRMLKAKPPLPATSPTDSATDPENSTQAQRVVTAQRPNHVWHVDLTVVPTLGGFWCSWLPFTLPQVWPFCYWVALVVDHFSRRIMGCTAFECQPTSEEVRALLGRAIANAKATPKYLVCDRGRQFDCAGFRQWCRRKGIKPPRYGAVGQHGSIAVVERAILTLKCLLSYLPLVPYRRSALQRELDAIQDWYNGHRPHTWLDGRTPDEVYYGKYPAHRKPRFETRARWPRGSPCARPGALVRGSPGVKLALETHFHAGHRYLPVVPLTRAA